MMSYNLKRRHAPHKECLCCLSPPEVKRSTRSRMLHKTAAVVAGISGGTPTTQVSDVKLTPKPQPSVVMPAAPKPQPSVIMPAAPKPQTSVIIPAAPKPQTSDIIPAALKPQTSVIALPTSFPIPISAGWYWQENDGSWQRFSKAKSGISRCSLDKSLVSCPTGQVPFDLNGCSYIVNLATMIQTNLTTGKKRQVIRVDSKVAVIKSSPMRPYVWFYQREDGKWIIISSNKDDTDKIEDLYIQKVTIPTLLSFSDGFLKQSSYLIDLANNWLKNIVSGQTLLVWRVQSARNLAITSSVPQDFIWQWKNDSGSWSNFDIALSGNNISAAAVETAYSTDRNCSIQFHAQGFMYSIDFAQMTQTNKTTLKVRQIQRKQVKTNQQSVSSVIGQKATIQAKTSEKYPVNWLDMSDGDFLIVTLMPTSDEYRQVLTLFTKTMNFPVKCIKRIQNHVLYQRYQVYKAQLEKRLGKGAGVRQLFHGTKQERVNNICKQGFDCRLHEVAALGKGSYFALDASLSAKYTDCSKMFLAEVLVGEYAVGNVAFVRPPARNDDGDLYDSCVNNVKNPTIFVTFDCAHSYPEYLIEY